MTVPPCVVADGSLSTGAPNRRKVTTAEAEVNAEAEAEAGMGKPVKKVSGREGHFCSADQTDHHDADVGDAATTTDSADDRREGEDSDTLGERASLAAGADEMNAAVTAAEDTPSNSVPTTAELTTAVGREARATKSVLETGPAVMASSSVAYGAATTKRSSQHARRVQQRHARLISANVGQLASEEAMEQAGKDASAVGGLLGRADAPTGSTVETTEERTWSHNMLANDCAGAPGAVKKDLSNGGGEGVTALGAGAEATAVDALLAVGSRKNLPKRKRKASPLRCIPRGNDSVSDTPSKVPSDIMCNAAQLAQDAEPVARDNGGKSGFMRSANRTELWPRFQGPTRMPTTSISHGQVDMPSQGAHRDLSQHPGHGRNAVLDRPSTVGEIVSRFYTIQHGNCNYQPATAHEDLLQHPGYGRNAVLDRPSTSAPSSLLALFKLNNTLQGLMRVMGTLTTPTPPHGRTVLLERVHHHLMEIFECTPHLSPTEFVPVRFVSIKVQTWLRRQLKDLTDGIALTNLK